MSDARKRILERRARFVAAALVTAGVGGLDAAACKSEPSDAPYRIKSSENPEKPERPQACLKIARPVDAEPPPMPCLSQPPMPHDAGASDAPAMPCLSPPPMEAGKFGSEK
jgi:hypothetical protein